MLCIFNISGEKNKSRCSKKSFRKVYTYYKQYLLFLNFMYLNTQLFFVLFSSIYINNFASICKQHNWPCEKHAFFKCIPNKHLVTITTIYHWHCQLANRTANCNHLKWNYAVRNKKCIHLYTFFQSSIRFFINFSRQFGS